ncbi:uncharacterized protein LOC113360554 [Papaver somniferum]|uniref:uncharacterized protein LOC113360554 n=1 Tax=Papaver somniferum TaxID=3469 RepID=UPI000E6FB8A6|nr:uncharacterized protein LOC113360554 [Papaver somniferum]
MNLQDLGFNGYPYTWSNKREDNTEVEERLDKGLSNEKWIDLFPKSTIHRLIAKGSDHGPVILKTIPSWKDGAYPFKWNRTTFGKIQHNIAKTKRDIDFVANNPNRCHTTIMRMENSLHKWQSIEENYLKTKSRNNVINLGDSNTSFFHDAARTRYRRNIIDTLQDSNGSWLTDKDFISNCLTNHFKSIATSTTPQMDLKILNLIPQSISPRDSTLFLEAPNAAEIKT